MVGIDSENLSDTATDLGEPAVVRPVRRRRLVLVAQPSGATPQSIQDLPCSTVVDAPDSHDERLRRVRQALRQDAQVGTPGEVMRAMEIVQSLAERVGRVDLSAGFVPREIRRQQWSFLNIPLMWAASSGDRSCAVLQRLADSAQNVSGGDSMSGRDAAMAVWDVLHGAMRAWGIRSREGLSAWVHAQGFPQPRWGAHFSGRAQERTRPQFMMPGQCIRDSVRPSDFASL